MARHATQSTPDHVFWMPDGSRWLAVDERGRPDGRPVLFLHPAPGSRLLDPDPWATEGARVRLITFDRPGYGGSSALPDGFITLSGDCQYAHETRSAKRSQVSWSCGAPAHQAVPPSNDWS